MITVFIYFDIISLVSGLPFIRCSDNYFCESARF